MNIYRAFGLTISSEFTIGQLPGSDSEQIDVRIIRSSLPAVQQESAVLTIKAGQYLFSYPGIALLRITNGDLIEVDPAPGCTASHLAVYLMGSCMGAILVQRGFMLLHGSCITDGKRSVLITGDSGAGKSTLAAEFLKRGWRLITDDVTTVIDVEHPTVQSSYPSQKLWQDALEQYGKDEDDIHSLYFDAQREKFGISVADSFFEGTAPLSMVVRLVPADQATGLSPIEGFAKVDQLLYNTYRIYLIEEPHRQKHFQRCVTLSTKIPMVLAVREKGKQCADTLYELITDYLEEQNHD